MIGRVIWVDSHQSDKYGLVSRVGIRTEHNERKNCYFRGVEPWAYVHEDETLPDRHWIKSVESGYESLFGDPIKRVTTEVPNNVNSNDDDVLVDYVGDTFEADLPMYRKLSVVDGIGGYIQIPDEPKEVHDGIEIYDFEDVIVDVEAESEIRPRVMMADIEVHIGEETFKETRENASQPINVICAYDSYEEEYSVFFYDKYDSLEDPAEVREILIEQWDDDSTKYSEAPIDLHVSPTEADMFNEFINYMVEREFDVTSGWNWVDFDYDYIINRAANLDGVNKHRMSPLGAVGYSKNLNMAIPGRPAFDMMEAFCDKMTFTNWRSSALNYVSNEELGVGKIDDVDINWCWKNHPERLIGYNIVDVGLTVALDDANDIHNFFYELADECSIPIYDTFYEKRLVDGYVMSRRGDDEILPTADESELIENAGGYVDDPVNGRHEKIGVSDLKSLYPSAMITANISTETIAPEPDDFDDYVRVPKVPEPKKVDGNIEEDAIDMDWLYCSLDEEGIIPRTLKQLFRKRNYEKSKRNEQDPDSPEYDKWDRKQAATKVIMNSFYGNASSKYWRLANEYLGDAITSMARYTLWKGRVSVEDMGKEAVYGDTDSHFIRLEADTLEEQISELKEVSEQMDKDASTIAQDIGIEGKHPYLEGSDLHGDDYTCMVWEPEKVYETWMQLGKKKRYAGKILWKEGKYYDNKISISGFEFRRSDSMEITAELQQEVIERILTGSDFDGVSEYIQSMIDQIDRNHDDVKKFALPGSINKALEDYPNRQVPRACMYSNEHLGYEFGEGDDPFVYMVKDTPADLPNTDVVALEWNEEIPDGFKLDKEAIIERGIKKPIETIIGEMDWKFNEIRSGKQQQTKDLTGSASNPFA